MYHNLFHLASVLFIFLFQHITQYQKYNMCSVNVYWLFVFIFREREKSKSPSSEECRILMLTLFLPLSWLSGLLMLFILTVFGSHSLSNPCWLTSAPTIPLYIFILRSSVTSLWLNPIFLRPYLANFLRSVFYYCRLCLLSQNSSL